MALGGVDCSHPGESSRTPHSAFRYRPHALPLFTRRRDGLRCADARTPADDCYALARPRRPHAQARRRRRPSRSPEPDGQATAVRNTDFMIGKEDIRPTKDVLVDPEPDERGNLLAMAL